jgi:hypothetical protein
MVCNSHNPSIPLAIKAVVSSLVKPAFNNSFKVLKPTKAYSPKWYTNLSLASLLVPRFPTKSFIYFPTYSIPIPLDTVELIVSSNANKLSLK